VLRDHFHQAAPAGTIADASRPKVPVIVAPVNECRECQVALAWLLARSQPPIIPIPGASTVAQLDEILAAVELTLDTETVGRLDEAGRSQAAGAAA
jgi:aryl-alcohol dehydrogenase-like predicted oxidoreductase